MIRRIVSADDLRIVYNNLKGFAKEHPVKHYGGIPFNPEMMYQAWANDNLLVNRCVIVCNFVTISKIDAISWFTIGRDFRVDKIVATSYLWLSTNNKHGLAVFNEAVEIMKRKQIDVINVGFLLNSESAPRIEKLLQKRGFIEEDKSYSLIL